MDKSINGSLHCHRTKFTVEIIVIYILILTIEINGGASEPHSLTDCVLNLQVSSSGDSSRCAWGDWDGFLHSNFCGEAFDAYLYALGRRANQTGQIYLSSAEQRMCLSFMKNYKDDIFSCGIEKLTSGTGACSDFSVADVIGSLGDELRSLEGGCQFLDSAMISDQLCPSCMKSWSAIKGTISMSKEARLTKLETDLCRFAVLLSLTSRRIEEETYVHTIYRCLGTQTNVLEIEAIQSNQEKPIIRGTLILIGVVSAITVIIIVIIACILSKRCLRPAAEKNGAIGEVLLKETLCPRVPIREMYAATDNLNEMNVIGEGTSGKVYKGIMSNNQDVAIKHIMNEGNLETFVREVTSLSHVRHPNLVSLLGCCVKEDECFLVYELCPNGSLSDWLFGKDRFLSWSQRLEIAIGSARGLCFLHSYPKGCIVHRDVKPTNILLGPKFEAKLSDFGLSKVIEEGETYASSEVRGTFGYVDPEYQSNRQVNSSGDIYSFGIVLLQVLSGKKVINMNLSNPIPINKIAKALNRGGSISEFADPKLQGDYSPEAFDFILKLALSCTTLMRERPSMEEVVIRLEKALDLSTMRASCTPENASIESPTLERNWLNNFDRNGSSVFINT